MSDDRREDEYMPEDVGEIDEGDLDFIDFDNDTSPSSSGHAHRSDTRNSHSKKKSKSKKSKKRKRTIIVLVILLILGVGIAIAPTIYGKLLEKKSLDDVDTFLELVQSNAADEDGEEEAEEEKEFLYPDLYAAMVAYNEQIYEEEQCNLSDSSSYTKAAFTLSDWGLDSEVFGVVQIPSLNITMPLYLGASTENLALGAAQLCETSMPIGGINTNAVIAGHCSWKGANYFRYLCNINIGDYVFVTNLWETLVYQVTETAIIDPYDSDAILIQDGKDMVTLFTCHPYASGGKYRFVAYCERVTGPSEEVWALIEN